MRRQAKANITAVTVVAVMCRVVVLVGRRGIGFDLPVGFVACGRGPNSPPVGGLVTLLGRFVRLDVTTVSARLRCRVRMVLATNQVESALSVVANNCMSLSCCAARVISVSRTNEGTMLSDDGAGDSLRRSLHECTVNRGQWCAHPGVARAGLHDRRKGMY